MMAWRGIHDGSVMNAGASCGLRPVGESLVSRLRRLQSGEGAVRDQLPLVRVSVEGIFAVYARDIDAPGVDLRRGQRQESHRHEFQMVGYSIATAIAHIRGL